MNNSDRNELKRRFKKDNSISRLSLCYVNREKEKIVVQNENFLNLPEEDMFKFLDIAKKSLGGTIGDNLLNLRYSREQAGSDEYRFLMSLKDSGLSNEALTDLLFDRIIEKYEYIGNYLITVISDSYDVIVKTSDKMSLDESEEVFGYILVSICPVNQTKPGLGYISEDNRMGARLKDWVAGAPEIAFMFPNFSERSADVRSVAYYTKDARNCHEEIISDILGCSETKTVTQHRDMLEDAISELYEDDEDSKVRDKILDVHEVIMNMLDNAEQEEPGSTINKILDEDFIEEALSEVFDNSEEYDKVKDCILESFGDEPPIAESFVDRKAVKSATPEREKKELLKENYKLKGIIEDAGIIPSNPHKKANISVRLPKFRDRDVEVREDNGKRFLVIPLNSGEDFEVN